MSSIVWILAAGVFLWISVSCFRGVEDFRRRLIAQDTKENMARTLAASLYLNLALLVWLLAFLFTWVAQ